MGSRLHFNNVPDTPPPLFYQNPKSAVSGDNISVSQKAKKSSSFVADFRCLTHEDCETIPRKYFKRNGNLVLATEFELQAVSELATFLGEDENESFLKAGGVFVSEQAASMPPEPEPMHAELIWV